MKINSMTMEKATDAFDNKFWEGVFNIMFKSFSKRFEPYLDALDIDGCPEGKLYYLDYDKQ